MEQLYSITDKYFIPQLQAEQANEQVETIRKQLNHLQATPLKLSEIARKIIRMKIDIPTKDKFQQLDLTGHLVEFLGQSTF